MITEKKADSNFDEMEKSNHSKRFPLYWRIQVSTGENKLVLKGFNDRIDRSVDSYRGQGEAKFLEIEKRS